MQRQDEHAVIVIGAGPAGATAALQLARAGVDVAILEKSVFPRFHLGESFLPANFNLICELGLLPRLRQLPHICKVGAEFSMGDDLNTSVFRFANGLLDRGGETFNIARAPFDAMLLDAARDAGAVVYQPVAVTGIDRLDDHDVRIQTDRGSMRCRFLIDASGQSTVLGRYLGVREVLTDPHLRKIAYFDHFTGVERLPDDMAGIPTVAMCDEGWFWSIPLDDTNTSVGFVAAPDLIKRVDIPANRMLYWGLSRCPLMRSRMRHAQGPARNRVASDFSYRCRPSVGRGYFMIGDAAIFMDPVFSTGVCLGMQGGIAIAQLLGEVLSGRLEPAAARQQYLDLVAGPTRWFIYIIQQYYTHAFREMFLHGRGPLKVHRAVLALLAGHVYPQPAWPVRWRCWMFQGFLRLQPRFELAPHRPRFSLMDTPPEPMTYASDLDTTSASLIAATP